MSVTVPDFIKRGTVWPVIAVGYGACMSVVTFLVGASLFAGDCV